MLRYLQLQKQLDVTRLQAEVAQLQQPFWKQHYNKKDYTGDWSVLPLRSINGSLDNVVAIHAAGNQHNFRDTPLLANCPYLRFVLQFFECEKTTVRLMKLRAGAVIKEHRDHELCFEDGEARIHIPVFTNPDVHFLLEGERVPMQEGECWYLNLSLRHCVRNAGATDRVHLVIDCLVNDWLKEQFTHHTLHRHDSTEEKQAGTDRETKEKIIRELRQLKTPTAVALASQLEKELL